MIEITLASKPEGYTREDIKKLFNKYSTLNEDLDEFITAMIKDRQLKKQGDVYYPTDISNQDEALDRPTHRVFTADRYGGLVVTKKGKYPRLAVAAREDDDRPDPTSMRLISYQNKRGEWIKIPEEPVLLGPGKKPSHGRKGERWRASIPAPFMKTNNYRNRIKPGTPLRVRIDRVIPRYFAKLTLWGFEATAFISWFSTSSKSKARELELRGEHFQFEVKKNIQKEMKTAGEQLIKILRIWLYVFDRNYYKLIDHDTTDEKEEGPHTGSDYAVIHYKPPRPAISTMTFKNLATGKEYAHSEGRLTRNWDEEDNNTTIAKFFLQQPWLKKDIVQHKVKSHPKSTWAPPKDETKESKIKRQMKTQGSLGFDNQPFKRKTKK